MRPLIAIYSALVVGGCAGQTTSDPCVWKIDVLEAPATSPGITVSVKANLSVTSGKCNTKESVSWRSSRPTVAEIVSATDSSAIVTSHTAGNTFITAFLARIPAVRDSITLTVARPTDNP